MKEIRNYLYDTIALDPAMQALTGYDASDNRIYLDFPPEAVVISAAKPAYITMVFGSSTPISSFEYVQDIQYDDQEPQFNVWGLSPDNRDDVIQRIEELFKDHSFWTTSWRVLYTRTIEKDLFPAEIHSQTSQILLYRGYIQLRLGPIYKR